MEDDESQSWRTAYEEGSAIARRLYYSDWPGVTAYAIGFACARLHRHLAEEALDALHAEQHKI